MVSAIARETAANEQKACLWLNYSSPDGVRLAAPFKNLGEGGHHEILKEL